MLSDRAQPRSVPRQLRHVPKHAAALEDIALDEDELFRNPNFRFVENVQESKSLNQVTGAIIIAVKPASATRGATNGAPAARRHIRQWQ